MPTSNQGWPEEFGFQLGGSGPSYILSVEEGSSAHLAGLQAGDQVLEIEGQNVSTLAPQAVIAIAQTQKNIPPSIGVVSRIQQAGVAAPNPKHGVYKDGLIRGFTSDFLKTHCLSSADGHHTRSRWSIWVYHSGRLPSAGGRLLSMFPSRARGFESRRLCHGGERHPREAARDGSIPHQGFSGPDAPPGGSVSRSEAETKHERGGKPGDRGGGKTGPQAQSSGVQQEGTG